MEVFDVLIVYSAKLATSANSLRVNANTPFAIGSKNESYNVVYSYFLKTCHRFGLRAAFTTSADIIGAGKCDSFWTFEKNIWTRVNEVCYSEVIFDKFSPTNERIKIKRDLLFGKPAIKPFNNTYLYEIFFDKQKTNNELKDYSIPTVTIEKNTSSGVNLAFKTLKKLISNHINDKDFSNEIVLKDRFGAGGIDVYKFHFNDAALVLSLLKRHINKSFIIQPLIKFDKGFTYNNSSVSADIRLIFLDGKIIQTYIRMAKKDDFRCNEHQGGTLKYLSINKIPKEVINTSKKIAKYLNQNSSLYALDFIKSNNNNIYLIEGNTGPGLDWNLSLKQNTLEAKKLIRIVVKKLCKMSKSANITSPTTNLTSNKIPLLIKPDLLSPTRFIQI